MSRRVLASLAVLIVVYAAPPAARAQAAPVSCTTSGKNLYVRDVMSDLYLWYSTMPNVNPTSYASPEAYLEAVRYKTLDSTFSYITSRAANDAFYSDSQFIGFGLSTIVNGPEMRVLQVFPESPASGDGAHRQRRDRYRLWSCRHRRGVGHRLREPGGHAPRGAHDQRTGHDSNRVVDADLQRGRPPDRLHLLP